MRGGSRHSRPGTPRGPRVAEQLHQELAEMIRGEVKDPRIGLVTLTGVDLTPDYAVATVHFTVMPSDEKTLADTLAGLRASAGFLRSQIGRRVRIHTTPEIRFRHDPSVERGLAMDRLIDEAVSRHAADDGAGSPAGGGDAHGPAR